MVCQQGWEHGVWAVSRGGSRSGGLDLRPKLERWPSSIWEVLGLHVEGYLLPR